eukprot:TRINITY_DN23146_c0_g1_i1.p1 TRINITY_DN23146_c0_g1~~TRINITY_DN23146_c0_g1_i1.p1  ORF type:complete len:549 (+),score=95.87 TRINITY_DN23146_c0_g1_i1:281-1927(+)
MEMVVQEPVRKRKKKSTKVTVEVLSQTDNELPPYVAHFPSGFQPEPLFNKTSTLTEAGDNSSIPSSLNSDLSMTAYEAGGLQVAAGGGVKRPLRHMLVAGTPALDYVGASVTADRQYWSPCQYALGVFNKEKGTLQVVPIAGGKVLRMEPRVRGVQYGVGALEEELAETEQATDAERRRMRHENLTTEFGSKKKKAQALALARGTVQEEHIGGSKSVSLLVQEAAQRDGMVTLDENTAKIAGRESRNIPPYEMNAATPAEAYPVEGIIAEEELESLDPTELLRAAKAVGERERMARKYPLFVVARLSRLRTNDKYNNDHRANLLLYITYLIRFYNSPPSLTFKRLLRPSETPLLALPSSDSTSSALALVDASNAEEAPSDTQLALVDPSTPVVTPRQYITTSNDPSSISEVLRIPVRTIEHFISSFCERVAADGGDGGSGKYRDGQTQILRPKKGVGLLISSILVLALHVDDFSLDPEDLAADLRLTQATLFPYFKELGCHVAKERVVSKESKSPGGKAGQASAKYKVTLPVPLKFPQIGRKRSSKSR